MRLTTTVLIGSSVKHGHGDVTESEADIYLPTYSPFKIPQLEIESLGTF